jgi:hypothetical protein
MAGEKKWGSVNYTKYLSNGYFYTLLRLSIKFRGGRRKKFRGWGFLKK